MSNEGMHTEVLKGQTPADLAAEESEAEEARDDAAVPEAEQVRGGEVPYEGTRSEDAPEAERIDDAEVLGEDVPEAEQVHDVETAPEGDETPEVDETPDDYEAYESEDLKDARARTEAGGAQDSPEDGHVQGIHDLTDVDDRAGQAPDSDQLRTADEEGMTAPETAYVEPGNRWVGDGPVPTEDQVLVPDPVHPDSPPPVVAADPETPTDVAVAAGLPKVHEPLLTDDAEDRFLESWNLIQIGFVDDPRQAVRNADALVREISAEYQRAIEERRARIESDIDGGSADGADTEALRLALRTYRGFVTVLLPKVK